MSAFMYACIENFDLNIAATSVRLSVPKRKLCFYKHIGNSFVDPAIDLNLINQAAVSLV